jgi:hypothetical protein
MGVLEELLRQLADAAEAQKRTTLPGTPPAQTQVRPRPTGTSRPAKSVPPPATDEPGMSRTVRQLAETAPALVIHRGRQHPILSRFRQPGGAQDAVVLAEIMAPRGRWHRR